MEKIRSEERGNGITIEEIRDERDGSLNIMAIRDGKLIEETGFKFYRSIRSVTNARLDFLAKYPLGVERIDELFASL